MSCSNGTLATYTLTQQVFNAYLTIPLTLVGIFGNCYCLSLIREEYLPLRSMKYLVQVTSVADTLILISSLFMVGFPTLAEVIRPPADSSPALTWFKAKLMVNFYPVAHTARSVSTWMSTVATGVRLLMVRQPGSLYELSPQRSKMCVNMVWIWGVLYNLPRWFELQLNSCSYLGKTISFVDISILRALPEYKTVYLGVLYGIFMLLVPVTVVFTANIYMTIIFRRKRTADPPITSVKKSQEIIMTEMALMMGREFLVCSILPCLNNVLEILLDNEVASVTHLVTTAYKVLVPISNLAVLVNAMSNTAMYLYFSRKYEKAMAGSLYMELGGINFAANLLARRDQEDTISLETELSD